MSSVYVQQITKLFKIEHVTLLLENVCLCIFYNIKHAQYFGLYNNTCKEKEMHCCIYKYLRMQRIN